MINRREFVASATGIAASVHTLRAQSCLSEHYIEKQPVAEYHCAPQSAYEAFQDMKFGARIHWGIYSIWHRGGESWPFLPMSLEDRQKYNELYKTWNPAAFDAAEWMSTFQESGMKMFAFTTKHHEGFSMFNTRTRVRSRANWTAPGGPKIEACDLAYSITETPFRRDVVKELCDEAHKRDIKIDLYFSHPDWYDADFRPYVAHPLQVPDAGKWLTCKDVDFVKLKFKKGVVTVPGPRPAEEARMAARHRAQLLELLTNYGTIDMMCLDMSLGPRAWPAIRDTLLMMRKLQPNVMLRSRGIGSYGDYTTPERVVPGSNQSLDKPWFCIYPLGKDFSYEPDPAKHKGTQWIVHTLADTVAKGGGLMVGVGPSAEGKFHPEAVRQMKAAGVWLKVNGEAIYSTRARDGANWSEGDHIRYTRSKDRRFAYAIATAWPGPRMVLRSVQPKPGSRVTLLGSSELLPWNIDSAQGTVISLPETLQDPSRRPCEFAWAFKIEAVQA
jgi:alpha-L-fucosidase